MFNQFVASGLAFFLAAIVFSLPGAARGRADDAQAILSNMNNLMSLVGTWSVLAEFHQKDGTLGYDAGTYKVSPVLEGTYLQLEVELHDRDNPSKHHSFLTFITYNPVTGRYDSTYFYSRWALRVTETGEYNPKRKEFHTTAFIPLEECMTSTSPRS